MEELSNETLIDSEDTLSTMIDEAATETPSGDEIYEFNSTAFWAVNAFISCVFLVVICWCCFGNMDFLTNMHQRREETDRAYQATVREREERRKQARLVTPEQRRRKLLQSMRRHKVVFVSFFGIVKVTVISSVYLYHNSMYMFLTQCSSSFACFCRLLKKRI